MIGVFDDFRLLVKRERTRRKRENTRLEREEKVLASTSFNKALKRLVELEFDLNLNVRSSLH